MAQIVPASVDPVKIADAGGITVLSQVGDTGSLDGKDLTAQPVLAESWSPNKDGTVWTFKLREGVKFHNGKTMTADDVVATIDRLADPENGSNALSAFTGMLSKGGTRKVDDYTVEFHLDAPNGNFPYTSRPTTTMQSSSCRPTYAGDFEKNMIGTGPFKLEKYTPKSARPSSEIRTIGAARRCRIASRLSFYDDLPAADPGTAGRSGGRHHCRSRCCRALACSTIRMSRSSARRRPPISRSTCAPTWIRSRTSGFAARSRSASIGRRW